MNELLPVNQASANIFLTQCLGEYSGHMSMIAHNPTIRAIVEAHGVSVHNYAGIGKHEFADFLRAVANQLSPNNSSAA